MFTDQYFQTRMVVMGNTRENKRLADWEALNSEGRNIVVLPARRMSRFARDNFPNATVTPMVAEGLAAPLLEVAAGRADAIGVFRDQHEAVSGAKPGGASGDRRAVPWNLRARVCLRDPSGGRAPAQLPEYLDPEQPGHGPLRGAQDEVARQLPG